jgi:uncharacterized protein YcfJ
MKARAPSAAAALPASAPVLMMMVLLALGAAAAQPAAAAPKAAAAAAAAAAPAVRSPAMRRADVAPGAGESALPGVGPLAKRDPNFRESESVGKLAMGGTRGVGTWDLWMANFERSQSPEVLNEQREMNRRLRNQPIPTVPEATIPGKCVPFKPPAPYKTLQEYCTALARLPWQETKRMFMQAQAPAEWLGVRGCTVGCMIGDNIWQNLVTMLPALGPSWSGKCIIEDKQGKQTEVLQAICPRCAGIYSKRPWNTGMPSDLGMNGVMVELGKSWLDGQPAWVFEYSKMDRSYGVDFHAFRDEVRLLAPGIAIGSIYLQPGNATAVKTGWNPSNITIELGRFLLLQAVSLFCRPSVRVPHSPWLCFEHEKAG